MSDAESSTLRLEDGEIDESNEPSVLKELITEGGTENDFGESVTDVQKPNNNDAPPTTSAVFDADKSNQQKKRKSSESYSSEKAYLKDEEIVYIDENEMLCVRGASPVAFVVERLSYGRKSPLQDCDTISLETTPPKRRRTTGKRHKKRTTPRKLRKDRSLSSDENIELEISNDNSQSPQESRDKLPQLCKFYLQDCCVKKSRCEYMHSEFPCKFYYMGLECKDETSETGCKLAHGGYLSEEMLSNLTRHIITAPIDVLGEEFIEIRSEMSVGEINQKLKNTQDKLTPLQTVPNDLPLSQNDSSTFFATLRNKLYFLNEDQLRGLQQFEITKVDDLLNLTLAQLNSIGIHAIQIEAIQMSFVAGQDTDMRNMLATQSEMPIEEKTIPSFEVVCFNDGAMCGQNWYEEEEGPLVIDETNETDDDENKDKTSGEDGIIIDVVGDSDTNSNSSTTNEKEVDLTEKDENEFAAVSITDSTDQSQHFLIEETQEGIRVLPNSSVFLNKNSGSEFAETTANEKEIEELTKSEEFQAIDLSSRNQNEVQLDKNAQVVSEHLSIVEDMIEKQIDIENQDEAELDKNTQEVAENLSPQEIIEEQIDIANPDNIQLDKNTQDATENESPVEDMIETQTEIKNLDDAQLDKKRKDANENLLQKVEREISEEEDWESNIHSPTNEFNQTNKIQEEKKINTPPALHLESPRENRCISPFPLTKSPKKNKLISNPHSEKVIAEIDLTLLSPPRRSTQSPPTDRSKTQLKREYINPFQRKQNFPDNENKHHFSPVKAQRNKYLPQSNFKPDHQMQGDNSSEDWDADEKSDIQSPPKQGSPKEIASPDQSEDESTNFVADGTCPEFPRRTKNLDNYQPALEINAHLTYPPMEYKLYGIYMPEYEVNKPTLVDKLLKSNSTDPRLKKFIEKEKNHGVFPQSEYSFFPPNISQCDPRLRPGSGNTCPDQYYNVSRVLYSYLQRSQWYLELKSNLKIQINHSVSDLVRALNYFHKDPSPQKIFDLFQIECAGVLLEVMRNVGIFIDVNGNITEEANYKQLCAPMQQQQPPVFGGVSGCLGSQQPPKPGLLGFAPAGVPHPHPHQNNSQMNNENSFARQAFGSDCFCINNNNDFQPNGSGFYVGGRFGMNRNQEPDFDANFEPVPYQRQPQKRHFKRH